MLTTVERTVMEQRTEVPYDRIDVGDVYRTTYRITPEIAAAYRRLVGEVVTEGTTSPFAPPWVFCSFVPLYDALGGRFDQGTIHLRQRMEMFGRVQVGEELDVEVRVTDKYVRKGRNYAALEVSFLRDGEVTCRTGSTFLWGYAAQ